MNCKQLLIAALCVLFFYTAKTQMNAPIIDRIIRHDPSVKLFSLGMHAVHKYIVAAAIDAPAKQLYLLSSLGKVFYIMPLEDKAYAAIMSNKISAFDYFDSAGAMECTIDLEAENELRSNGKLDKRWMYADVAEEIFQQQKAGNDVQKLIALENNYEATSATRWEAGCYNPKGFNEDSLYADEAAKGGSMETHADTTTYYNANDLIPLFKATLLQQRGIVYYYNRRNMLLDSLHITHAQALVQQKADVFVMYRYWLERESNNIRRQINDADSVTNEWLKKASLNNAGYVNEALPNEQRLEQLKEAQRNIDAKIEWAYVPDFKAVATVLHYACKDMVQNTEFLETAGVGYFINFVRGQKQYELTDQRGNVLVTVSDKLIGMQTSGNRGGANVSYYAADIIGAQDYYSYGMVEPGRKYNSASAYRYGFNGQEKSLEIDTFGNLSTAQFWELDTRIGKRWNKDPKGNPSTSAYISFDGNPIWHSDALGDTAGETDALKATPHAAEGVELIKKSPTFKKLIAPYDIGGSNGFISGTSKGSQSDNVNVVFDVFDDSKKQGLTTMEVLNNKNEWVNVDNLSDPSSFDKNSKVRITIYVDPQVFTNAPSVANTINHEFSAHGTGYFDVTNTMRRSSSNDFIKTYQNGTNFSSVNNDINYYGYWNTMVQHSVVAAGLNQYYNQIYQEVHGILTPQQRAQFRNDVTHPLNSTGLPIYNGDLKHVQSVFKNLNQITTLHIYND